jgi:hypothetical protein
MNWLDRLIRSERRAWCVLTAYALVSRLPLLTYPKACDDEQVYAVVAIEMLHGGQPYISAVERKPPFLFYVYDAILRMAGPHNYFALHLACLLWVLATMASLYVIMRHCFNARTGFIAALFYAVFSAWADYSNLALNGEIMMNLSVVAALAVAFREPHSRLRPELLMAGALVAVAFLLKQPSVVAMLSLVVYLWHPTYRRRARLNRLHVAAQSLLVLLGFAGVLLLSGYWLHRLGILGEAWYWSIANHANPLGPTTWFFWHKLPLVGTWFVGESMPLLALAGWSIAAGVRNSKTWESQRPEFAACVVLLLASAWGVAYNGQFNFHYFLQLTPALALLAAPIASEIASGQRNSGLRILQPRFVAAWIGLTALLFFVVDTIGLSRNRGPHESAVYVRRHSQPTDRIFMWGQGTQQTGVYLDAERRPASRYIASFPLNGLIFGLAGTDTSARIVPGSWDRLRTDFERHPPKFIIDCHAVRDGLYFRITDYPYLRNLLATQYQLVLRAKDGIVYERTDAGSKSNQRMAATARTRPSRALNSIALPRDGSRG